MTESTLMLQIVIAIRVEQWRKCARKKPASASANRVTVERVVTSASPDISVIRSASRATAARPEVRRPSAMLWANVPATRASPDEDATSAAPVISNTLNASVNSTISFIHASINPLMVYLFLQISLYHYFLVIFIIILFHVYPFTM